MPVVHNYSRMAGKTYYWDTSDSQEKYREHIQNPDTCRMLQQLGYIDNHIEYSFNQDGFRTSEFDHQYDIVCFGCSFTMGTGVAYQHTWPAQLEQITGLTCANLGHSGSSNDTVFRMADYYLEKLRPRYAVWLQTDSHRIELLDDGPNISLNIISTHKKHPCEHDYFMKVWFSSESNHYINQRKNTLAFEKICDNLGIKSIIILRNQVPCVDLARDLMHPGEKSYKKLAEEISQLISQE